VRLSAFAEDVRFRVDRTLLLAIPRQPAGSAPFDEDARKLRSNLAYGAGLTIPLGGAVDADDRPASSLKDLSLPLDAFAGVLDWSDATGLRAQTVAGVRTGIDFGPLVGLRAYYWRGVERDFARRDGVQSWGAEAQFNLNSGSGVTPFLIGGAGQVDFTGSGVRASGAAAGGDSLRLRPADRTALIVGGGVKLPLTNAIALTAAARNYVTTRDSARLQDVNTGGQLRSNWQYTAGLSLGLGRRGRAQRPVVAARADTVYLDRGGARVAARDTRTMVVTARGDTLRGAAADSALGLATATAADTSADARRIRRAGEASYASDRHGRRRGAARGGDHRALRAAGRRDAGARRARAAGRDPRRGARRPARGGRGRPANRRPAAGRERAHDSRRHVARGGPRRDPHGGPRGDDHDRGGAPSCARDARRDPQDRHGRRGRRRRGDHRLRARRRVRGARAAAARQRGRARRGATGRARAQRGGGARA
jgi:hypothetical protein